MSCQGCFYDRPTWHKDWPCAHLEGPNLDYYSDCQNKYDPAEEAALAAAAERFRP